MDNTPSALNLSKEGDNSQMDKFEVPLQTPCVYYDECFLSEAEADDAYKELLKSTAWEKTSKINRYVALHEEPLADDDANATNPYKYRDAPGQSTPDQQQKLPFSDTIRSICHKAEAWYNSKKNSHVKFNVCLLNFYEDGTQRIGWHCDREEIGRDTPIASISLGATRDFQIRAKEGLERTSVSLQHGSLVIMENICQLKYVHCLPKMAEVTEGRINLTFRCKTADTPGEEEHERRDKWLERITDINDGNDFGEAFPNYALTLKQEGNGGGIGVFGDIQETEEELKATLEAMTVLFSVKTNIGAEGYAAAEVEELLNNQHTKSTTWTVAPRPWGVAGYVAVGVMRQQVDDETKRDALAQLLKLRSALFVMQYHDRFDLEQVAAASQIKVEEITGEHLYQFYKQRLLAKTAIIPTLEPGADGNGKKKKKTTFRVTCERIGNHPWQAPTVEFEVGGAMAEYFDNIKPKMEDFDVNVRVDVIGNQAIVGTQHNFVDLSKRHFYRYRNKVTIKSNLAYIMLRCANLQPNQVLLDPFCGSATILLEAMEMESSVRCIGLDVNRKSVQGAQDNANAASQQNNCQFHCVDVRGMRRHVSDKSVDCIVSNLPWGVQTGHKKSVTDLQSLYEHFLRISWYVLKDQGRIVLLVLRGLQLTRILRKLGGRYRILRANVVRTSNNLPCLVVVEKLSQDTLNDAIKGQLAFMSRYVNVSREIYHAIHDETIADGIDVPESNKPSGEEKGWGKHPSQLEQPQTDRTLGSFRCQVKFD